MKTLLERLEPEIRQQLDQVDDLYPNVVEKIFKDLINKSAWGELEYDTIFWIVNYCNLKDYSPHTINQIFRD